MAVFGGHYPAGLKEVHTLTLWLRTRHRGPQKVTLYGLSTQKVRSLRPCRVSLDVALGVGVALAEWAWLGSGWAWP